MLKLLHHSLTKFSQASPFDEAIVLAASGQPIKIVSPYIGLSYIKRIIGISSSWQLISDVDEWLAAAPRSDRSLINTFIEKEGIKIRHFPGVHAKAVIGPLAAYVGSANLTLSGLLSREELGFLIDTTEHLQELHGWFDALWNQATFPDLDQVREVIDDLNENSGKFGNKKTISASVRTRKYKLVRLGNSDGNKISPNSQKLNTMNQEVVPVVISSAFVPGIKKIFSTSDEIEELALFIDMNASIGFSFIQVLAHLRSLGIATTAAKIYFDILPYCANRSRSVFSSGTINRLIYLDGKFIQSNKQLLEAALEPFDLFLQKIIFYFEFEESRLMKTFATQVDCNLAGYSQKKILIDSLLKSKFLIEKDGFCLNESWDWNPRFKLFSKSYRDWEVKRRNLLLSRSVAAAKPKVIQADQKSNEIEASPGNFGNPICEVKLDCGNVIANSFPALAQQAQTNESVKVSTKISCLKGAALAEPVASCGLYLDPLLNYLTPDKKLKYSRCFDLLALAKLKSVDHVLNDIRFSADLGIMLGAAQGRARTKIVDEVIAGIILRQAKNIQIGIYDEPIRTICKSHNIDYSYLILEDFDCKRQDWICFGMFLEDKSQELTIKGKSAPLARFYRAAWQSFSAIQTTADALRERSSVLRKEARNITT